MNRLLLFVLILTLFQGCNNSGEEESSDVVIVLEQHNTRVPLTVSLIELWVTDQNGDVITSGINKDQPLATSTDSQIGVYLPANTISRVIVRVEYVEERVFMGYIDTFITPYTEKITISIFETPLSSNIQSFNELHEYIQNNF